ncbi:phytanoyl-CoA dioxygenase family protein [Pseudonocardia charpentierae]|uniref:Phytanoyl-CoA dioxygenase family protein n=1 Tax=Pseudonocardia charpentierae TaxID=3075545 RepID=A0ABU2NGI6_9PSEU|nr:phytanoyl-CoA dioxygenase family protein [Pseudonocardia sp. DSM 45834]MDT0352999.1 phytanoyl-CoA dioxygenase family protein [Pseudonocardia sp. DSM 45834]
MTAAPVRPRSGSFGAWLTRDDCNLQDFRAVVEVETDAADYPHADRVERGVLFYGETLADDVATPEGRRAVQAELAYALMDGPGIVVFKKAFEPAVVDRATAVITSLIEEQKSRGVQTGDHFAKPGSNDRLWSALEKLAVTDPETFVDYFANDVVNLVSVAWLGPNYQIVSDPNVVNPGGTAQTAHRDYHLGFMDLDLAGQFPAHVHRLSPVLTLQGAVAHVDMPVETGPTMYLPHSQKYEPGYMAIGLPEFQEYFEQNYVQLPLEKGDAVFFNPALLHGAGTNRTTDVKRMANLLQVSSAFGRAMGTVDTERVSEALYATLRARKAAGAPEKDLQNVVAAAAEGYAFPTNLDRDKPVGRLTPESQAELVWRALQEDWDEQAFTAELAAQTERRRSSLAR